MKNLTLIISAVLAASGAFAKGVTVREMTSKLARFEALLEKDLVKAENSKRQQEIVTKFVDASPMRGTLRTGGLNKKLSADIDGNLRSLDLYQIADSINLGLTYLEPMMKDSKSFEKKEDSDLATALVGALVTYRTGLSLIAAKVSSPGEADGRAVGKLLVMGMKIAQGTVTSIAEVNSFQKLIDAMIIEIQKNGLTAEEALRAAIRGLGGNELSVADVNKKIEEILGCKI